MVFLFCWIGFFWSLRGKSLVSVVYVFVNLVPHGFAFCGWKLFKAPSWFIASGYIPVLFAWERHLHIRCVFLMDFHPLLSSSVGGLTSVLGLIPIHPPPDPARMVIIWLLRMRPGGASLQTLEAEAWERNGNLDHDLWFPCIRVANYSDLSRRLVIPNLGQKVRESPQNLLKDSGFFSELQYTTLPRCEGSRSARISASKSSERWKPVWLGFEGCHPGSGFIEVVLKLHLNYDSQGLHWLTSL